MQRINPINPAATLARSLHGYLDESFHVGYLQVAVQLL
jgi:hypothetical protein